MMRWNQPYQNFPKSERQHKIRRAEDVWSMDLSKRVTNPHEGTGTKQHCLLKTNELGERKGDIDTLAKSTRGRERLILRVLGCESPPQGTRAGCYCSLVLLN